MILLGIDCIASRQFPTLLLWKSVRGNSSDPFSVPHLPVPQHAGKSHPWTNSSRREKRLTNFQRHWSIRMSMKTRQRGHWSIRISSEIRMDQWPPNLSESSGLHRHQSIECSSLKCLIKVFSVAIFFACHRGHLGPSGSKSKKKSENGFPRPLGAGGRKSRKRVKIDYLWTFWTLFRLFFEFFSTLSRLFRPPRPRGPGNPFSDFFLDFFGPEGPEWPL